MKNREKILGPDGRRLHSYKQLPIGCAILGADPTPDQTGSWRVFRPSFVSKIAPCREACPIGIDIQRFIWEAKQQRFDRAWEIIMEQNPFPSICGRVCGHSCEETCNRMKFDEPLAIHALERWIGDHGLKKGMKVPVPKLKGRDMVAVLGAGPAGLSCAYHLRRLGYGVKVFDRSPQVGGMLRLAIPDYRLPRGVLDQEIMRLKEIGIEIEPRVSITKEFLAKSLKGFKAVFLAVGAQKNVDLGIPGEDIPGVLSGLNFLKEVKKEGRPQLGRKVVVIGGGNTAIDVARTALRLGSKPTIIYRRSRREMPAVASEVEEAIKEGVCIKFRTSPVGVTKSKGVRLECVRNRLGEPGSDGRKTPVPLKGSNFFIESDAVIVAMGETVEKVGLLQSLECTEAGIAIDEWGATQFPRVFAGGDVTTGQRTVSHAIGSGKKGALAIDALLRECDMDRTRLNGEVVTFKDLNLYYFKSHPRQNMPQISDIIKRVGSFDEVHLGFSRKEVLQEAERCFHCGLCSFCGNCFTFCPDSAVLKEDKKEAFVIDYNYCKGCGICSFECPTHTIVMVKEEWVHEKS